MSKKEYMIEECHPNGRTLSIYSFEGPIDEVLTTLHAVQKVCGQDAFIKIGYDLNDEHCVEVWHRRPETEKEKARRLKEAARRREERKKQAANKEIQEREQLRKLQEKYGGTV